MTTRRPLPASSSRSSAPAVDELRALQLARLRWTLAARLRRTCRTTGARSTRKGVHPDDLKTLADLAQVPVHRQGRPARQLSVRHVRRAARAASRASTRRRARPASRPSSATRWTTSTPGPTWSRARSAPPAAAAATWCTSPTATASSPAAWARTTAPSALGCTVIPMSGGQTEKQVQLIQRPQARHHHGHAVVHAGDLRGVRAARASIRASTSARGRHLRRRAVDRGDAAARSRRAPASTRSTSTACPK